VFALPLAILAALNWITSDIVKAYPGRAELSLVWALQVGFILVMAILHLYLYPSWLCMIPRSSKLSPWQRPHREMFWQTLALLRSGSGIADHHVDSPIGLAIRTGHLVRHRDERDVADGPPGRAEPDRD